MTIHDTGILSLDSGVEALRSMDFIVPYNRVFAKREFC